MTRQELHSASKIYLPTILSAITLFLFTNIIETGRPPKVGFDPTLQLIGFSSDVDVKGSICTFDRITMDRETPG